MMSVIEALVIGLLSSALPVRGNAAPADISFFVTPSAHPVGGQAV
jgi:hypothetical protein